MSASETHRLTEDLKDLYQNLRIAAMNRCYYGSRLEGMRRGNMWWEIAIALGGSAAIASWVVWKDGFGEYVWLAISGVATVLAALKPYVNLAKQIERYSKLFVGHGDVQFDLERLAHDAKSTKSFDDESRKRYAEILARFRKLGEDDDPEWDNALRQSCFESVKQQLPAENYWLPPLS